MEEQITKSQTNIGGEEGKKYAALQSSPDCQSGTAVSYEAKAVRSKFFFDKTEPAVFQNYRLITREPAGVAS